MKTIDERVAAFEEARRADYIKYGQEIKPLDSWTRKFYLERAHADQFSELAGGIQPAILSLGKCVPLPTEKFPGAGKVVESFCWEQKFVAGETWGDFVKQCAECMVAEDMHHVFIEAVDVRDDKVVVSLGS